MTPVQPQPRSDLSRSNKPWGLHWFRRDLRVFGNPSLQYLFKLCQGRVLGIFFFDQQFLARPDFSHRRFGFFLESLKQLQLELRREGSDLWVIDCDYKTGLERVFSALKAQQALPSHFSFNEDYEPYARQRDLWAAQWLQSTYPDLLTSSHQDHLILAPQQLNRVAAGKNFYQVYSPFCKKWLATTKELAPFKPLPKKSKILEYLKRMEYSEHPSHPLFTPFTWKECWHQGTGPYPDALEIFIEASRPHVDIALPPAGFHAAINKALEFFPRLNDYVPNRDFPSQAGTSGLSVYLKNGTLTTTLLLSLYEYSLSQDLEQHSAGKQQFLKELIWREFYYHLLFHCPEVETESFLPQYRQLKWPGHQHHFTAWKAGQTGYPIVDAGMRELRHTGHMHNRVRMIVASFLTKDLLLDWRLGEQYFMEQLLDGDLAANSGGWQWASSVGCDPQPYFRIFNPWLQGQKFDPDATYIKKFIPELSSFSAKQIHDGKTNLTTAGYPAPIVIHAQQKELALALYRSAAPKELL